jgi:hypothetical protein
METRSATKRVRSEAARPERAPGKRLQDMTRGDCELALLTTHEQSRRATAELPDLQRAAFQETYASELAIVEAHGDREREDNFRVILRGLHRCGSRNIRFLARLFGNAAQG